MADMFLDPIMEKLISAGLRYLKDQVRWQKRTNEELEKLKEILPQIQAVVHFASSQEQITDQNPPLKKWLWQLRDAIDDADDVLDELEYMELEKQLTKNKKLRRVRSIMKSMKKRLVKIGKRALKIDPNLKKLEEVVHKLYRVSTIGIDTFFRLVEHAKQEHQKQQLELHGARETGSLPKNDLIGRGRDKESVVQWLRKPSNEHRGTDLYRNISLLSIVGHGGVGKTTLLQHIYEDEMTKEFDLKMWVCVSNNFDAKEVIADMLELLKKERPRLEKLEALQGRLKNEVMSKRFLLVLDDVWEDEEERDKSKWENVLAPLASGDFGSKILVTSRTGSVALMFAKVIKKKEIVKLEGLEEDECLQLLNSHAFAGVENPPDDHKKLRAIAGEIVKKLLGSPLAAKVIGGVLNSLDLDEKRWRTVLESNLLAQNSINSILRLSYIVLSNPLKSCFAFCGMFAQDRVLDKDDLIRMWIALGFIQPSLDQEEIMEDIGGRYFDVLVKKNFFDKFERYYKMHDLIHELAQSISIHECLRVENSTKLPSKIPETLRHLSVETTNLDILRKIEKFKHLHSLFLVYEDSNPDLCSALIKIFKASRSLRLLYLSAPRFPSLHLLHESAPRLEMIPEEIGNLINLRYLKITLGDLTMLPRSLSNLYHLQYIIYNPLYVQNQIIVDFFPSDINNLSNLRYVKYPTYYISLPRGIGKLKYLQELNEFDLRDVSGYRIGELENMNDLCKLGIYNLENVKDAEEACNAKLCAKRRLTDLTLCWSNTDSRNIDLDENVLDNLQPPKCLRNLRIEGYMGARSAIWMKNVNPISNLERIDLLSCMEWETLPPFGQLPFLKYLRLCNMPKVKWLESKFNGNEKYHAFPLLEKLYIEKLEALEDWFEAGVAAEDGCLFPCLIELVLRNCPKLKELPSLPPKLKSLDIEMMGWKTLNFCSNSNPIPLETLKVSNCQNITSLPLADEIEDWFEAGVAAEDGCLFPCLIQLFLLDCPKLKELPSFPSKLKILNIANMGWKTLNFCSNSNPIPLESLWVHHCPNITSLPLADEIARLAALRFLTIRNCPNLISLGRYREVETTNNCYLILNNLWISDPSVLLMEPLRSIASLKELRIEHNDELVSFPNEAEQWFLKVRSSLSELFLSDLKSLQSLPSYLESLSSLQKLYIHDVPMLRELPNLLPSLKSLTILGRCHPELKERYREDGGSDRHKIAHIPHIHIDP